MALSRLDDGVELVVHEPARTAVVDAVVAQLAGIRVAAIALLALYLRPSFRPEVFWLDAVEVLAERSEQGEDTVLSFSYAPADDPEAEGYTRFDVFVRVGTGPREQAFRAVRFAVGFH